MVNKHRCAALAGICLTVSIAACKHDSVKPDERVAADSAPTAAMANAIDISAPRDKMWYAVYYNKKGIEKAMEDLTGQPSRLGVEGFKSLRSCASTGERADVPNGARGSMYALYFSSADGDYIKDPLGHPVIECVRGQGARSFAPLTLDEPPNDDACSQPACAVMKFGVLYCRC